MCILRQRLFCCIHDGTPLFRSQRLHVARELCLSLLDLPHITHSTPPHRTAPKPPLKPALSSSQQQQTPSSHPPSHLYPPSSPPPSLRLLLTVATPHWRSSILSDNLSRTHRQYSQSSSPTPTPTAVDANRARCIFSSTRLVVFKADVQSREQMTIKGGWPYVRDLATAANAINYFDSKSRSTAFMEVAARDGADPPPPFRES